jgi:hypothetical protein
MSPPARGPARGDATAEAGMRPRSDRLEFVQRFARTSASGRPRTMFAFSAPVEEARA